MQTYKTILLGGGMVAGYAAKQFSESGLKSGELGIISADTSLPYERPPLSKGFLCETTMVFPDQRIMKNLFTPPMSQSFQKYFEQQGVQFLPKTNVTVINGRSVELSNGNKLDADLIVAGIGAQPETKIAEAAPSNIGTTQPFTVAPRLAKWGEPPGLRDGFSAVA